MQAVSSISLSGMGAAQTRLGVAAHNIANQPTAGFRRQVVEPATQSAGGVKAGLDRSVQAGNSLEHDMVEQMSAKHQFMANLSVFRTADAMAGTLLSLRA